MASLTDSVGGTDEEWLKVTVDYKDLLKKLENYDKQMPNIAIKLMRAVNNKAKADIRKEARKRGYHARKPMPYGEGGFSENLKSYADKGYKAKIIMKKDAYWYTWIEYGANVVPRDKYITFKIGDKWYRSRGFVLPAHPIIHPIANKIWGTDKASEIMEKTMQKEIEKRFKKKIGVNNGF